MQEMCSWPMFWSISILTFTLLYNCLKCTGKSADLKDRMLFKKVKGAIVRILEDGIR